MDYLDDARSSLNRLFAASDPSRWHFTPSPTGRRIHRECTARGMTIFLDASRVRVASSLHRYSLIVALLACCLANHATYETPAAAH